MHILNTYSLKRPSGLFYEWEFIDTITEQQAQSALTCTSSNNTQHLSPS